MALAPKRRIPLHRPHLLRSLIGASASLLLVAAFPLSGSAAGSEVNHPGTVHSAGVRYAHSASRTTTSNLTYHGSASGAAVVTGADKVYIVTWGWGDPTVGTFQDPSAELPRQQDFFSQVGGSNWNNSVTQYCQGSSAFPVAIGATVCPAGAPHAVNPAGVYTGDNYWNDTTPIASNVTQSALAAEAVKAATHFGNVDAATNRGVQYIIDTPHGHSISGFGTQFCAWHSSATPSWGGAIAYTNFPYITDGGTNCGQNYVNSGSAGLLDGVTIVGGHEFAETETDIYPNGGWLDGKGSENGDKCAWLSGTQQGASTNVRLSSDPAAPTFAVQSLWSNAANAGRGGCVTSY
jgi:hypothetical protein